MNAAQVGLFVATFLASAVEMVEAFTIVLAMGLTSGWRSALAGTAAALVALTIITAILGVAMINWFPEALLQLIVGTLLLIFGLQWLHKAVLRSAGLRAQHDEEAIFEQEREAARRARAPSGMFGLDAFGFVVAFKGVLLEGLEVVFIVLTFGITAHDIGLAAIGAVTAAVIVLGIGAVVHRPLAKVPENTIKYGVGLLLTTFGTFWAVEGLGEFRAGQQSVEWPFADLSLVILLATWFVASRLAISVLRRRAAETPATIGMGPAEGT